MKKNKKVKGFTLIELIIVLAIFGIILAVVLSLINPVSRIMNKAQTRERTAAYSDNISEYLDNSLHYSSFMYVYKGGFTDIDNEGEEFSERFAINQFASKIFDYAVGSEDGVNYMPITGQIRVMKLINEDTGSYKAGRIYESAYSFEAKAWGDSVTPEPVNIYADKEVINPEHFEDYNYFYDINYATLDPIENPDFYSDAAGTSFESKPREYYNCIKPMANVSSMNEKNFCINVISYKNGNMVTANYDDTPSDPTTGGEEVTLFKSPAHLTAASMSLPNMQRIPFVTRTMKTEADGSTKELIQRPTTILGHSLTNPYILPFDVLERDITPDKNIYIIYVTPDEIFDTQIEYFSSHS